jgi:hypothetical protein
MGPFFIDDDVCVLWWPPPNPGTAPLIPRRNNFGGFNLTK